jgi:rod shape-determining protein MreD
MGYLIGLPLMAFLAILQSSLMGHLQLFDGRTDLVLLAVVSWGLAGRSEEALAWGMVGGLFLDLLSGLPFGVSALGLILVAFLVSLMEGRFWEAHLLMPLGVMLFASFFYHLIGILVVLLTGREVSLAFAVGRIVLPSTFLNVALALPASQLAIGLKDRLFPPEVEL